MKGIKTLMVVVLSLVLGVPGAGLAQNATPTNIAGGTVDPVECQVEPRTADELVALWYRGHPAGSPVAATAVSRQALASIPVPLGERANEMTVAGVNATMREVLACSNAGDAARYLALFSDDLAVQYVPILGETPEDIRALLETAPEPVPSEQRSRLVAVTNVVEMDDGRVGALITTVEPANAFTGADTVLALFVEGEGGWLVDDIVELTVVE